MYYLSAGESHGEKYTVIIQDVPCGIQLSEKEINFDLKRRSTGPGRSNRQDDESNLCKITSGVNDGKTTGAPVCIEVLNSLRDDITNHKIPRPGHADLSGVIKYNFDDCLNVSERSSGRESVARVCAGVVAKNMLAEIGVEVYSYVSSIGSVSIEEDITNMPQNLPSQTDIAMSSVMCPDKIASEEMLSQIDRAIKANDSLGGKIKIIAVGLIPGIGDYSQGYERLDSKIGAAILSVPSVKSVEIGSINYQAKNVSSASVDQIVKDEYGKNFARLSNYSGGIEGGMTNGMPIVLSASIKPVPSVKKAVKSIDLDSMEQLNTIIESRADVCVVPNIGVICEAELAIVLASAYQKKFGYDSVEDMKFLINSYKQRI